MSNINTTFHDDELDICPFCESDAEMVVIDLGGGRESFMPRCQNKMCCARVTRRWNERTSAVSAWNTRIW